MHVRSLDLQRADDSVIWEYALTNNLVIVTQDSDYADWNKLRGSPPQIIWLRCGNTTVDQIHHKIRTAVDRIQLMEIEAAEVEIIEIW